MSRATRIDHNRTAERFDWPAELPRGGAAQRVSAADWTDDAAVSPAIEQQAYAAGYAKGELAGYEAGAQRVEVMLSRLACSIEELATQRHAMLSQAEGDLAQLSVAIAERIVRREVTTDRELVVAVARAALARLDGAASVTIRLNPADHVTVAAKQGDLGAGRRLNLMPDDTISRGGCKIDSDVGLIDATIDAQFEQVANALLGSTASTVSDDAQFGPLGLP